MFITYNTKPLGRLAHRRTVVAFAAARIVGLSGTLGLLSGSAFLTMSAGQPGAAFAQAGREAVRLAAHRAVYEISLERASPGSGIAEMTGRMVYELTGSVCEGFTQNMRFVTRMADRDGSSQVNDLRTSTWEEGRGERLRFNLRQYRNDKLAEATQGDADRASPGAPVSVEIIEPKKKDLKIAADVYFPMQHSQALIRAAKRGDRLFAAPLYDGSEKGEKVFETTSFIGDRYDVGRQTLPGAARSVAAMHQLPSWPVAISYFEPGPRKVDAVPAYELSFRFFENGVSTKLLIDYGDFAIRGKLANIELLPQANCDQL